MNKQIIIGSRGSKLALVYAQIAKNKIKRTAKTIFLLHQIHSNRLFYIDKKTKLKLKPKADAVITSQKNIPIGVLTADCVPILISDKKTKLVAAIHAGWKGAYKDIISRVIQFMIKKGSSPKNITAAIGPAISAKNYEVKQDFKRKFIKKDKKNNKFIFSKKKSKNLIKGYSKIRKFSEKEKKSLNVLCRGSALRYLLTRTYDYLNTPKSAVIKIKNPREYIQKLKVHNQFNNFKNFLSTF